MDDSELFNQATADTPVSQTETQTQTEQTDRPRDEQGRFTTAQTEQQTEQPSQAQTEQAPATDAGQETHRVPLRELLDEREKRQEAARKAELLEQQIAFLQQQRPQQPQPQQPGRPEQPPNPWDDLPKYLDWYVQPLVQQFRQELSQQQYAVLETKDGLSREHAEAAFGEDTVNTALAELNQIVNTPEGQHEYRRIMSSRHPYGELVKWHRNQQVQAEVGADPNAWLEKKLEERLNDPTFLAKAVERARGQAQQPAQNGQQRPNIDLPPSLVRTPAARGTSAADDQGSMDQSDLWRVATAR